MQAEQRRRKFQDRVGQYAAPYARATAINAREKSNAGTADSGRRILLKWLKQLVAFDPAHLDSYPLAWWIVSARGAAVRASDRCTGTGPAGILGAAGAAGGLVPGDPPILPLVRTAAPADTLRAVPRRSVDAGARRPGRHSDHRGMRSVATDSPDPTGREFRQVADQLTLGVTLEQALHALAARNQLPEYGFFATALALQSETGGTVSDTLERLAEVIRKRVALREHARALASEARTSIYILAALPVFAGGALAVINPDYLYTLFIEPQGRTSSRSRSGCSPQGSSRCGPSCPGACHEPAGAVADGADVRDLSSSPALSSIASCAATRCWRRVCEACSARSASRP